MIETSVMKVLKSFKDFLVLYLYGKFAQINAALLITVSFAQFTLF